MEELSPKEQIIIFNKLDKKTAAKTLVEADEGVQESFFKGVKNNRIIELLESLPPYRGADLLSIVDEEKADKILAQMITTKSKKIKELLQYKEDTAGGLMRSEIFTLLDTYTAKKAIQIIRKECPSTEQLHVLIIVDKENHLVGTISMRTLLTAKPNAILNKFMRKDPIALPLDAVKEDIATALEKYNFVMLPVVDKNNVLKGTVTADEVLSEIMPESWIKRKYIPRIAGKRRKKK
ncbi:hypothetical protein COV16_05460 [Candidatus Woesearchaeota archaeon CG10_big_fil_rev_8_21_14_0_10_34_8]|nr:MAG: hypothetical protein COV16_05460 [Candidatus Woesearchaeota archaeon CG10_big_fil_rev_8_21_14_0_10_34_8]